MIKKNHKTRHSRYIGNLWSKIWVRQQEERMKDYDMIFENGRVLFVKKEKVNET